MFGYSIDTFCLFAFPIYQTPTRGHWAFGDGALLQRSNHRFDFSHFQRTRRQQGAIGLLAMVLCFSGLIIATINLNTAVNIFLNEMKLSLYYTDKHMQYSYLRCIFLMVAVFATKWVAIIMGKYSAML